jgi:hypothetical protein
MKRFIAMTFAAAILPAAAFADTTVSTPKNLTSKEEVAAYVGKLEAAVKRECQKAAGPVIGVAFYAYKACIKETRAAVAEKEPTGLYAKRDSADGIVVAAQ